MTLVDPAPRQAQRRFPRFDVAAVFIIEKVNDWGAVVLEERALSENIGLGGVRLRVRRAFRAGDFVMVREPAGGFEAHGRVVGRSTGSDGLPRLDVAFLGERGPDYLFPAS